MPIRKRNGKYQADIQTSTGTRLRRSFATMAEAKLYVRSQTVTPEKPISTRSQAKTVGQLLSRLVTNERSSCFGAALRAMIGTAGDKLPLQVSAIDVAKVCDGWARLRPSTRHTYHAGLRRVLEILDVQHKAHAGIPSVKAPDARTVVAPPAEFERVLKRASIGVAFCLLAARDCALRAGTIYRLCRLDVRDDFIVTRTKNDTVVKVPVSARLKVILDAALQRADGNQPFIHALGVPASAFTSSYMSRQLKRLQKEVRAGDWTWHDLRRTAAQNLYRSEKDLHLCQALLGHKGLAATLIYLGATRKSIDPATSESFVSGGAK